MKKLGITLGSQRLEYSKEYFNHGSITKVSDYRDGAVFFEITVNDSLQRVELYYNKCFGAVELCKEIGYYDYINKLSCASDTALLVAVEDLLGCENA